MGGSVYLFLHGNFLSWLFFILICQSGNTIPLISPAMRFSVLPIANAINMYYVYRPPVVAGKPLVYKIPRNSPAWIL